MFSIVFVFFKQKTAYELRISDWSSDVCSSDLVARLRAGAGARPGPVQPRQPGARRRPAAAGPDRLSARLHRAADAELGSASCRARVWQYVEISMVAVSLKPNKKQDTHVHHTDQYSLETITSHNIHIDRT